jgi:tRNA threonylcarbamoyladenosine biosynthesis protein TsaE
MRFEAHTEEEMIAVGERLAALLPERAAVILTGDLGAGKTTLTKGIAKARAGVDPDDVSSPTFSLIHEYGSPTRVYHVDLYRLDTDREVLGLGLADLLDEEALVLIEWGERFAHLFGDGLHRIEISATPLSPDTSTRQVLYSAPAPSPGGPSSSG